MSVSSPAGPVDDGMDDVVEGVVDDVTGKDTIDPSSPFGDPVAVVRVTPCKGIRIRPGIRPRTL
jgi:hypothetical protein